MTESRFYKISGEEEVPFHNQVDYCVGTGRIGLALQAEYQEQLALVQQEIGFQHIRGHGLFSDDMAIYQEYRDTDGKVHAEYNFTYLDLVMDAYQRLGLRPFLELGFMPEKLARGDQKLFYWQACTTPPKDYSAWCDLVTATLSHLMGRYGADEVVTWPIEVWNEPNLPGFWENADMQEYFRLFERTFLAIKGLDSRFRVGGPAICGVKEELWMRSFLEFCREEKLDPDFLTRHHYAVEPPEDEGHYCYSKLSDPEEGFANLRRSRELIDEYPEFRGKQIHVTEFNTSYSPNCPLHDTNQNAAYIALQLSRLGDVNESYSYWTFGDIFEENGVPFAPFHGGFGLVANGGIPKPTFWTFQFFKNLSGKCVHRSEEMVLMDQGDGKYCGVAWNCSRTRSGRELELAFELPSGEKGEYVLLTKTVDEETCNPLRVWHDMGEPSSLSGEQKALLKEAARPFIFSRRLGTDGGLRVSLHLKEHAVEWFSLSPVADGGDRGYDYQRTMQVE